MTRLTDARAESSGPASDAGAGWGMIPVLGLVAAIGIFTEALADVGGRAAAAWADPLFWGGLLLIFIPFSYYAVRATTSRTGRVTALALLGMALYLLKVLQYPFAFSQSDEFQHWLSALDIAQTRQLFHQNTLLPISPLYPGLEIVTNALSSIGGVSTFVSATLLIGAARLLLMLVLFLFTEGISHSHRTAAIATLLYLGNPLFLFFDAQFAYESLAVPLAVCALFVIVQYSQAAPRDRWKWLTILWLVLIAITVTHHLTSYALVGLLLLWFVVRLVVRRASREPLHTAQALLSSIEIGTAWLLVVGDIVVGYLAPPLLQGIHNILGIIIQEDSTRLLFHDGAGVANPVWQQLLSLSEVVLLTAGIVIGCVLIYRRHGASATILALGVLSLAYPISQMLRLTKYGAEYATRPMDVYFLAVAFVVALVVSWLTSMLRSAVARALLPTVALTLIFAGGVAIGSGPSWAQLPGPHIVEGNQRSFGLEDVTAAQWALTYLGSGNRVATDHDDALLMGTYGLQTIVTAQQGGDLAPVYFASTVGPYEKQLLQRARVRFVVVDLRLASALPADGVYYESDESSGPKPFYSPTHPISRQALTKYGSTPEADCIYDSGNMLIYDMGLVTGSGYNQP